MSKDLSAPLFSDSFALCDWLLGRLGRDGSVLAQTLCRSALDLLRHIVLALKGFERDVHLDMADRELTLLRVQLRLAASTDCLTESQLLHALGLADRIGRQLGGWMRSLEAI